MLLFIIILFDLLLCANILYFFPLLFALIMLCLAKCLVQAHGIYKTVALAMNSSFLISLFCTWCNSLAVRSIQTFSLHSMCEGQSVLTVTRVSIGHKNGKHLI